MSHTTYDVTSFMRPYGDVDLSCGTTTVDCWARLCGANETNLLQRAKADGWAVNAAGVWFCPRHRGEGA